MWAARWLVMLGMLMVTALAGGCGSAVTPTAEPGLIVATLSVGGDSGRGQVYFNGTGTCNACHSVGSNQIVGPGLAGVMRPEGPQYGTPVSYAGNLPDGQPRNEENLAAWIRSGGQGEVGLMTPHEMSDAEMADLLAYLRTLTP
jgi:cytochrome c